MISDPLTREIIRRIFANLGVAPPPNFGIVGITEPIFKLEKTLTIEYEDGEKISHSMYGGSLKIKDSVLKAVVVDLSIKNEYEYAVVFQFDNNPIYGLRLAYNDEDCGIFLISGPGGWLNTNVYTRAQALAGMELVMNYGNLWSVSNDLEALSQNVTNLVEM